MNKTRAFRKSGYTQKELAFLLGIHESTFSQKKNGTDGMHFTPAEIKTLELHGVPVDELFHKPKQETVEA